MTARPTGQSAVCAVLFASIVLQVQWLLDRSSVDMAAELWRFLDGLLSIELDRTSSTATDLPAARPAAAGRRKAKAPAT